MAQQTPMMKQYLEIKAQYKDAFLFFRLGDFYEMFFEDAKLAARELEITLTGRGQGEDRIPMCGVPYHSADQYMSRLIEKGYKIAICEQVEDPKQAKGVVKREVVKLLTPGTVMNGNGIKEKENNYLVALTHFKDGSYGLARTDLTTGECAVTVASELEEAIQDIASSGAKELVVASDLDEKVIVQIQEKKALTLSIEDELILNEEYASLCKELKSDKLIDSFSRLLNYLIRTQKRSLSHLQEVTYYSTDSFMKMDTHTKRNLELTESLREKKKAGSLLAVVDQTVTAMGGRLVKNWLERPLIHKEVIEDRLEMVTSLLQSYFEREELRDELRHVYDLERLAGRIAYGSVNARELVQLKRSLQRIPSIKQLIQAIAPIFGERWFKEDAFIDELVDLLEHSLLEDPPISVTDGGMIRAGFHEELDTYRDASKNGKQWIAELERKEREATGVKSLKIGFNKVFGYYIEVTRANLHLLPEGRYERKQTLTNAERYVTPELKEKEALILEAEEKMEQLEYDLFVTVRDETKQYLASIQELAHAISEIDVLAGFASVSEQRHYVRPTFSNEREIEIVGGRHPVVETVIAKGQYVANDVQMTKGREMLLITGPNMAGKSTYMRQLALLAVMAQIGCYVPAESAELPIFDQVFTRIGAADDLASGQSTFMVEMLETRYALKKATENSLILLDEIGRGTSTYDGMALAQAIIEYIHNHVRAKTLFSTHYHELTELEGMLEDLKNVHVAAVEEHGSVVFLHKVVDGQADRSYGIYVAELAELPKEVTDRAEALLEQFESSQATIKGVKQHNEIREKATPIEQLSLFEEEGPAVVTKEKKKSVGTLEREEKVIKKLVQKDVLNMTPIEAIQFVNELQRLLK
ncbi:DNA mismatch repair protein MutS [Halalkalibacter nanhaiisediminis]|uniref:DNA mismatch repair protein MutS n=1 Tax=Halalkalibacter nanhaiisediminis TaxID=688079 RepID=A0A562QES6_9BACI|nr:DNA mismatch repair protein MutS [Halalkalibacter nanhaiisediminis]TWI55244.1 DNA mismatch repair protein MutS [Halalkalibacter nanhaiisediminis]